MAENDDISQLPENIKCDQQVTDIVFLPHKPVLVIGDIAGNVRVYSYSDANTSELRSTQNHKKAVRCVRVTDGGNHLYTASKDKSWSHVDLETGQLICKQGKAHGSALYSMEAVDQNVVITGDEDGYIKMWDMRRLPNPVMELKENDDYISDMVCHEDRKNLLVTSGDGTLSCVNIKKRALDLQSEIFDSEFLSIAVMKNASKVVCGDGDGTLEIFNWGEWGNISDRYPGHPLSIDCMLPLSNDFLCTGCMDGKIRLVHILPNSIESTIGSHGEFPIQSISISHDGSVLASASHDEYVKFWRTPDIESLEVGPNQKRKSKKVGQNEKLAERRAFFDDL